MKRCPGTRCPELIPRSQAYCRAHQAAYDARRGSSAGRGYGTAHRAERARTARQVASLQAHCHRCGLIILPTEPWDLGHSDDRTAWIGPEHARCNRSAGGTKGAKIRNQNT